MGRQDKRDQVHNLPFPEFQGSEADRLGRAAEVAFDDGDYEHARELLRRAQAARRRAREEAAGVPNMWR